MKRSLINKYSHHICTAEQMRACDKAASEVCKIPSVILMENAALSVVRKISARFDVSKSSFAVFCGKGNNAGDGLAIARHLYNNGAKVELYFVLGTDFSGDAKINYDIVCSMQIPMRKIDENIQNHIKSADCVIDAIFGTGLSREFSKSVSDLISAINENSKYTVSVDIPSGVCANDGMVFQNAIKADETITFAEYKRCMFLYPGAEFCGNVTVCDISIPDYIKDECCGNVYCADKKSVFEAFPKRLDNTHKGDFGKVMIVGGSYGMAGAVCMATRSALKMGAGLVTACVPKEINDVIQTKIDEAMTIPLDFENCDGLADKINKCDAVAIGMGLGREDKVADFIRCLLPKIKVTTIIDADAIYALSKCPEVLKQMSCDVILTPHSQELGYLVGKTAEEIEKDRFLQACNFATENKVTLILKGHHTIIVAPSGEMCVNNTGNSGMATGGSGDVLSGMITALAKRMNNSFDACVTAVYLHGLAGDYAMEKFGKNSMTATDIIDSISHILPLEIQNKM